MIAFRGRLMIRDDRAISRITTAARWFFWIFMALVIFAHMVPEVAGYRSIFKIVFGDI